MSSKITKTNIGTQRSVVAIAQEESKLKAIELREQKGILKVLWTKSSEDTDTDWRVFAAECGLSVDPTTHTGADDNKAIVVGFNSAGVVFYRMSIPAVGEEETASIVKLQAETRLPLPVEQMELAWRADQMQNGQVGIIVAAARKKLLQGFVENVRSFEPTKILLDCEGIVKAWKAFFSGDKKHAVVVSIAARNTQVCLAEDGRLSNAMVLDIGMEDLAAKGEDEQMQTCERFVQDMRSVLELFGYAEQAELPVFVLSDGDAAHVSIVSSLRSAGLNARVALPDVKDSRVPKEIGVEGIYEYRVPIGLGLMALEASEEELNIFEHLYSPASKKEKKHWLYSPKVACVIAAVMLVLSTVVFCSVDMASPGAIEKRLSTSGSEADINLLMQRQKLIKTVAQQRPDLLNLLGQVNASGERGIKLESFHFKKGQPVTITGHASSNDQLYKFEKSLEDRSSIKNVKRTSSPDAKTKKVKFSITFHYKSFTRR
ncbi:MAG: PilN domain-containing protein [Planctomycetes bacterium]|nr:PilN domain-containing protein [Planctomycetota bacterium]MCH8118140.1 PilN domain-containing protein [Planctomycetota bacterium]